MRNCVVPVLLIAARPAAFKLPSDQSRLLVALPSLADCMAVAAVWKSLVCSVVEPEKPLPPCTSTQQAPKVKKGLAPTTVPRRNRSVTERIVAPSGIAEVSNETIVLYCFLLLLSPTRKALVVLAVASIEPPTFEFWLDSSTQPSCAATDVKVTCVGGAGLTTCGAALSSPLLLAQLPVPLKAAVMTWLPTASVAVLNAAWPLPLTATPEASAVAPSLNVTLPVGTPPPGGLEVTVAVKVTDCPKTEGFGAELTVVMVASDGADGVADASFE